MGKDRLLVSFSGGRTSAYMTWWIINNWVDQFEIKVVFANTGKEEEATLQFINECDKRWGLNVVWVEAVINNDFGKGTTAKVVSFETAKRNGEPFEAVIAKYGIPNASFPHCTRELKTAPIHSYIRSIGWKNYFTAIGIRVDEFDRMNPKRKDLKYMYPLVTNNIRLKDVIIFWSKQEFDLKLQSYEGNCDLCWKKSVPKLQRLVEEKPSRIDWWKDMEMRYGQYVPVSRQHNEKIQFPIKFYRDSRTIDEIVGMPKEMYKQTDLFEFGCSESCEPF